VKERLNKIIAKSGICSRRKADELIEKSKVRVNGKTVTALGTTADPDNDTIFVNNKPLKKERNIYILLNKPKGYITTTKDPHAEKTVLDLLPKLPERLFPIGRLDKNTTGLLIMTNDGNASYKLTHPKFEIVRIYEVTVRRPLAAATIKKIEKGGLPLDEYLSPPCKIKLLSNTKISSSITLSIREGKKREIRKIFEAVNHPVKDLKRIQFGKLKLGGLKTGQWKHLKRSQIG